MSIKVTNDANNGTVTIKGAEVAGDYVVTTPAFSTELAPRMQLMTAQNSTSGTSINFTGIPSWAKKITVMFNGVSTNNVSAVQIQLGDSGGVETTGYAGSSYTAEPAGTLTALSSGFRLHGLAANTAAGIYQGAFTFVYLTTPNIWSGVGNISNSSTNACSICSGTKSLSGVLDRIRVTTVNGTDTFDAGQIGVLYEG